MFLFNIADFLGGPIILLALVLVIFSHGVEYQYLAASPSEVGNGAPSEDAATNSPSEVGMEVGVVWGIIKGMLFLYLQGCTRGVERIYLGCAGYMDVVWDGRFTW